MTGTMFLALCMLLALAFVVGLYVLAYAVFSLMYALARKDDVREIHPIPRWPTARERFSKQSNLKK